MSTLAERILDALGSGPLDDDVLAHRLAVAQRQTVNQTARRMEGRGQLRRYQGPDGKIVNALVSPETPPVPSPAAPLSGDGPRISEDEVKRAVADHLSGHGFEVVVAWGRTRGIDLDARHPDGRRYVVEAKAEVALQPQQVNYFVGALGELVQRMDDAGAVYGLALPGNRQYRGLAARLPGLARRRLGLVLFWVTRGEDGLRVELEQ